MAHRLELSYNWRLPVLYSSTGLVLCVGLLARGRANGWWMVVLILIALWGLFITLVWLRTRASLMVDQDTLEVRHRREFERVLAADLMDVRQFHTPHGPSYKLRLRDHRIDTGAGTRTVIAPTALLRGGHKTLFRWILTEAPQAELDKGSQRTVQELQRRGLIP